MLTAKFCLSDNFRNVCTPETNNVGKSARRRAIEIHQNGHTSGAARTFKSSYSGGSTLNNEYYERAIEGNRERKKREENDPFFQNSLKKETSYDHRGLSMNF
jgi:hypothetical protein